MTREFRVRRGVLRTGAVALFAGVLAVACVAPAGAASIPAPRLRPPPATAAPVAPAPAPSIQIPVSDAVGDKLTRWLAALDRKDLSASALAEIMASAPDWPAQSLLRLRYEQALVREAPNPAAVIAAFAGRTPATPDGVLLLAHALVDVGRKDDATQLIEQAWRKQDLSEAGEKAILADFRDVLTAADHAARVDRLIYAESTAAAQRTAKLLDAPHKAVADARIAVVNGSGQAAKLLEAVPAALRSEPGYILAKAQYLRRAGKYAEAAAMMSSAPTDPAVLGDPDVWSQERQELARRLIDSGDARTAYQLVAAARAVSQTPKVEAAFDAGWYALDYLHDPKAARPHFQAILDTSNTPISQARGSYWLGRVAEAEGNQAEARTQYDRAARYPTAFYGQIAAARLKTGTLSLPSPPNADEAATTRFIGRELVQALAQARKDGADDDSADMLFMKVATTLADPAEFTLLARLAQDERRYSTVVEIGKAAQARGLPVGTLAFPTNALPAYPGPAKIDLPVLYAIARQESTFDQSVVSSAGAVGIFQVMPQFAKETAQKAGIPFAKGRVRSDPIYNMQLGAAEIAGLLADYGGSYLLAFAAYNAGAARVDQWLKAYGDPRDDRVDVLDWIERIPFDETRNYVQRVLENLQVYRALLGDPVLRIDADMRGSAATSLAAGDGSAKRLAPTG